MANECTGGSVHDLRQALDDLHAAGAALLADSGGAFDGSAYTFTDENNNGWQNHFQGCQRLNAGPYLVLSGSDCKRRRSHLFILRMGSRSGNGAWGSNAPVGALPDGQQDRVVAQVEIDRTYWHAGGMDVCGDYLAVPIECAHKKWVTRQFLRFALGIAWPTCPNSRDGSRVYVFDMSDPAHPVAVTTPIVRDGRAAGAAALAQLASGHYLLAILSTEHDPGPHQGSKRIDFHLSTSANAPDGFSPDAIVWWDDMLLDNKRFGNYQSINLVCQADGSLFLIGLYNPSSSAPKGSKPDVADLFRVSIANAGAPPPAHQPVTIAPPIIEPVGDLGTERFTEPRAMFNFAAGAGVHTEAGSLRLYSVCHYRSPDGWIRFAEFAP